MNADSVKVAVRIHPLVKTKVEQGNQTCLDVVPDEPQIVVNNTDKGFAFNYVFGSNIGQEDFYNIAIKDMVKNIFQDIQNDQKKTSEELVDYEISADNANTFTISWEEELEHTSMGKISSPNSLDDFDEKQEEHTSSNPKCIKLRIKRM